MEWKFLQILTSLFSVTFPVCMGLPALLSVFTVLPTLKFFDLLVLSFSIAHLNLLAVTFAVFYCLYRNYSIFGLLVAIFVTLIAISIVILSYFLGRYLLEQFIYNYITRAAQS